MELRAPQIVRFIGCNRGIKTSVVYLGLDVLRDGPGEDLVEREWERDLFPFPFPFSCYRSIAVLCPFLSRS